MGGDAPVVSVCVTTYQHARFITECLASVLAQTLPASIEVLVGDDGSTDGARDLIADLARRDARIQPIFHPRTLGPTGNLNALVARAQGRFIAHLDGDDAWAPDKLAMQCDVLDRDPTVAAVFSNASVIAPDGTALGVFNRGVPGRIDLPELLRRGNFLNHSSLVYRASVRDAVLGMSPPYIDYRLHVRLLARGQLAYVDEALVKYRWRTPGSMIRTLPRLVQDGHLDAFREALAIGAPAADVRNAAGRFWAKCCMQGWLGGDLQGLRALGERLAGVEGLGAGPGWQWRQALLAPGRAMRSWWARRRGVYFP